MTVPVHVAIIMDGNGRWAKARHHARTAGHVRGARRAREIVREADKWGVKYLTLFAFSSENWSRPSFEVSFLMKLLVKWLAKESAELLKENVRVRVLGEKDRVPASATQPLDDLVKQSAGNSGLQLNFAFNYGARAEILSAVNQLIQRGKPVISEEEFANCLYTKEIPDPDLIIRTSGEQRISNFLLWQAAYSEFYFTNVLWPDFDKVEFGKAILEYQRRSRRFGAVEPTVAPFVEEQTSSGA